MSDETNIAVADLRSIIERVERLEDEKSELTRDVREVYAEAKARGYDAKTIRTIVKLRKMDKSEREETEALLQLYLEALGMRAKEGAGDADEF